MKHYFALSILMLAPFQSMEGKSIATENSHVKEVVNQTFIDDPELQDLFYMIAAKKIAESGKNFDVTSFMEALHDKMESNIQRFGKPFTDRFNENEMKELEKILESKVFEKFMKTMPDIMKESMEQLEQLIDEMITKDPSLLSKLEPTKILEITSENFETEILNSPNPVVLDFYATWCIPCKGMEAILQSLSDELSGKIKFVKLDVDKEKKIAEDFQVSDLPVLLFIKKGKVAGIQTGFANRDALFAKINELLM